MYFVGSYNFQKCLAQKACLAHKTIMVEDQSWFAIKLEAGDLKQDSIRSTVLQPRWVGG